MKHNVNIDIFDYTFCLHVKYTKIFLRYDWRENYELKHVHPVSFSTFLQTAAVFIVLWNLRVHHQLHEVHSVLPDKNTQLLFKGNLTQNKIEKNKTSQFNPL